MPQHSHSPLKLCMLLGWSCAGPSAQAGILRIASRLLLMLHCLDLTLNMINHSHSLVLIIFPPILHEISWYYHKIWNPQDFIWYFLFFTPFPPPRTHTLNLLCRQSWISIIWGSEHYASIKKCKIFTGRDYKMRKRSRMHNMCQRNRRTQKIKVLQTTIKIYSMTRTVHFSMAVTDFMEPVKSSHFQKSHEIYFFTWIHMKSEFFHKSPHKIGIFP